MPRKPADPKITRRQAETARATIRVSKTLQKLGEHLEGKIKLDSSQVQSARILLAKVLPDMTSIEQLHETPVPKTREEIVELVSNEMINKVIIKDVAASYPEKARACYEQLSELLKPKEVQSETG
jgi:hypothetical protein